MSPLAFRIGAGALALLALIALRGKRWAYLAFVLLGVLYFPAQTHFQVHAPKCEQLLPTVQQLVPLLQNYVYVALFAAFYWMSWVQFERWNARSVWALVATLLAAALVEVAEGMTGRGQCRVRDLVPDAAGAVGAALVLAIWSRFTRKPAYVRLVKRPSPAAPRPATAASVPAPPPRASGPTRGYAPPPPPPDFSPGPPSPSLATTHEVAPRKEIAARPDVIGRLQAIPQRLLAMLRRVWAIVLGHRRRIIVSVLVLGLVGAAAFVFLVLQAPPQVAEEPAAPPPPPSRPLQSDAEGYYEPGYEFTVADRRFTRLTLRPEAYVTFKRGGGVRQEAGCQDARIGADAVHLRCELDRVGMVTIDGRFPARFATSRLDAPVLSAVITVSNTRGETLYRGRDSFRWHAPD